MKKILSSILLIGFISLSALSASASNSKYNWVVNGGISKYKAKNYVGCIQDMAIVTNHDPSNAVAYYYLGNSYMKIGNKEKAKQAYDRVIKLNTAPVLTGYAAQAKYALESGEKVKYKRMNSTQTSKLLQDPKAYMDNLNKPPEVKANTPSSLPSLPSAGSSVPASQSSVPAPPSPAFVSGAPNGNPTESASSVQKDPEIEKMIKGKYPSKIHPDANKVIIDAKLQKQMQDVNAGRKSAVPSDEQIADAVKTLAEVGINVVQTPVQSQAQLMAQMAAPQMYNQNNEYAAMTALLGNSNQQYNNNNNNMMNMLPFLIQQGQKSGNQQLTADMVQAMMMSQMMPDFGFDSKSRY